MKHDLETKCNLCINWQIYLGKYTEVRIETDGDDTDVYISCYIAIPSFFSWYTVEFFHQIVFEKKENVIWNSPTLNFQRQFEKAFEINVYT